jgi:hypothetical protein
VIFTPQVQINSPGSNQSVGASINVSGYAVELQNSISKVEIWDGTTMLGTTTYGATSAPDPSFCTIAFADAPDCGRDKKIVFTGSSYPLDGGGTHTLYAIAYDQNFPVSWGLSPLVRVAVGGPSSFGISGSISLSNGTPLQGVTVSLSGGASVVTDLDGHYAFPSLASGGTYSITPTLAGYTFTPPGLTYNNLSGDVTNADFKASGVTSGPAISGQVTVLGVTQPNVRVYVNGAQSKWTTTDNTGHYSVAVAANGTYFVSPAVTGVSFNPIRVNITTSLQTVDFAGTTITPLTFVPINPCRIVDTRPGGQGVLGGPMISAGGSRSFPVTGNCGIPANATAFSFNVTAVPPDYLGTLTIWPSDRAMPDVSTLNCWTCNSHSNNVVANAAIVPASNTAGISTGAISISATQQTHVVLDVNGYFAPGSNLQFYPVSPCRVFDTRLADTDAAYHPPVWTAGQTQPLTISGFCGIPTGLSPSAYSSNVSVIPSGNDLGILTAFPADQAQPQNYSTLNCHACKNIPMANAAITKASSNGQISINSTDATDVFLDVNGYFGPATSSGLRFYPVTPCRVADTRPAAGFASYSGSMSAGETRAFDVQGSSCGIPSTAKAYSFNITVIPRNQLGNLTIFPAGNARPGVSTLNCSQCNGSVVLANAAIVPAGNGGAVSIFVTDATEVLFDINGYFAP